MSGFLSYFTKSKKKSSTKGGDTSRRITAADSGEFDFIETNEAPVVSRNHRASVCGEVFGKYNRIEDAHIEYTEKTPEEMKIILNILDSSILFSSLELSAKKQLARAFSPAEFVEGDVFIEEGEDGDCLYVIESGQVRATKLIDGETVELAIMEKGDAVGELSLLYVSPRAATCTAVGEVKAWKLLSTPFTVLVRKHTMAKRERYLSFLKTVPALQILDAYELGRVCDCITRRSAVAGEDIIKQGELDRFMYFIESGTAVALKDGVEVLKYDTTGMFFGELAILKQEPRAASVRAETDMELLCVNEESFRKLLGPLDELLKKHEVESY